MFTEKNMFAYRVTKCSSVLHHFTGCFITLSSPPYNFLKLSNPKKYSPELTISENCRVQD